MSWDNRVFNVNGVGGDMLRDTLRLAFRQEGKTTKCRGWKHCPKNGIILCWGKPENDPSFNALPGLDAESCVDIVMAYFDSDEAKALPFTAWDEDLDHDGSNDIGWRVFVEDWGHVSNCSHAICAVKPVYLWYGK